MQEYENSITRNSGREAEQYDFKTIESKWQGIWEKTNYGKAQENNDLPKHYHLVEFPYPSGAGLHVGHCMGYGASDTYCRMKRLQGYEVMYPIGWDAFGLPTENYAIKHKIKPQVATEQNIEVFKKQIKSLGYSFDWDREVNTTDPSYYKWTQWIFLQFYKHAMVDGKLVEVSDDDMLTPRLAFQAEMPVNWCPSCKIVLANEEVVAGNCERCGAQAEKRKQKQWMLRITSYADRLINDLASVDYLDKIKQQQINWIGKSEGSIIKFLVKSSKSEVEKEDLFIEVFTTRADTLFGCTYIVVAPESDYISKIKDQVSNIEEVENYINKAKSKSDLERTELQKEKTGVKLVGIKAINPINNEEVDVFVADYVLATYGTGAVMAVPAHDERDFEFAKKYGIDTKPVVVKSDSVYRSYLMGAEKITDSDLQELDINIIEKRSSSSRKLEIPKNSINNYEQLIIKKLDNGFWNEYVGEKIVFIFKHKSGDIERYEYNEDNKDKINQLCANFTNSTSGTTIIQDWVSNGADGFYHDYLLSTDYGVLIDSSEFSGLTSGEAKKAITQKLKDMNFGDFTTNFKLRDWIFSRQHYWGEPIPVVHCEKCGTVPLPEDQLPLTLPDVENYEPTNTGESPLSAISDWVETVCPKCGGKAKRETDTMPNWAGSSWYFLRYADPNSDSFFKNNAFQKPEIGATEKDNKYFEEFKKIVCDLEKNQINIWAANRFLLNGLNRQLWLPLRTISLMVWEDNEKEVYDYLLKNGYKHTVINIGGHLFEKEDLRVEIIPVFKKNNEIFSYSYQKVIQKMTINDLPNGKFGYLYGFNYRIVSPQYNLNHYKYLDQNESGDRQNLGDKEKIEFLEKWVEAINKNLQYWMPVDLYNGGQEHITLHLLYSRFWHKFLFDLGVVPGSEPYAKRILHGIILGPDGQKMSKSKGNVINPDDMVKQYGADTLRAYIMFIGPYDQESAWSMSGIMGVHRFLKRVWQNINLLSDKNDSDELLVKLNQTIMGVTEDLENFRMNTVISKLMEFNNLLEKVGSISKESYQSFLKILFPVCPHIASELWEKADFDKTLSQQSWPEINKQYLTGTKITIVVQINGKLRDTIETDAQETEENIKKMALSSEKVNSYLANNEVKKVIYVPGKLINFVI